MFREKSPRAIKQEVLANTSPDNKADVRIFVNDAELSVNVDANCVHIDVLQSYKKEADKNEHVGRMSSILARIAGRGENIQHLPVTETTSYVITASEALLDIAQLKALSSLELGEALPKTYGEQLTQEEAMDRLQELAVWMNPALDGAIQTQYSTFISINAKHDILLKEVIDDIRKDQPFTKDPNILFKQSLRRSARKVFMDHERNMELSKHNLAGLMNQFTIANALLAMTSRPTRFLADCYSELDGLQTTHNTIESVQAKLSEVNEAIRAIGENSSLASEKQATALELQSVELELRKKSLRFCTLAMLYDKGQPLPVAGFSRTLDDEPADRSPSWHTAINSIASLHTESACEDFTKLLHDITQALYSVRGDLDDPEINTQIAQYLVDTSRYATNLSRVQSLRDEINHRYSGYINIS